MYTMTSGGREINDFQSSGSTEIGVGIELGSMCL